MKRYFWLFAVVLVVVGILVVEVFQLQLENTRLREGMLYRTSADERVWRAWVEETNPRVMYITLSRDGKVRQVLASKVQDEPFMTNYTLDGEFQIRNGEVFSDIVFDEQGKIQTAEYIGLAEGKPARLDARYIIERRKDSPPPTATP